MHFTEVLVFNISKIILRNAAEWKVFGRINIRIVLTGNKILLVCQSLILYKSTLVHLRIPNELRIREF